MSAIGKSMTNGEARKAIPFVDDTAAPVNPPDLVEWMLYSGSGRELVEGLVSGIRARVLLSMVQADGDRRAYIKNTRTGETIGW